MLFLGLAIAILSGACGASSGGGETGMTQSPGCQVVAAQISPETTDVAVNDTINIVVLFSSTTDCHPTITWSTSDNSVLGVIPDGEVAYLTGLVASAQPVTVTAIVGGVTAHGLVTVKPRPSIKVTPSTLTFTAIQDQPLPDSQFVAITNGGGGVLTQVGPGATTYGPGASSWLFVEKQVLTSTAPFNLIIQPRNTSFPIGTYTATVPIQSPDATNSPQNLTVMYTITSGGLTPTISNFAVTLVSVNSCSVNGTTGNSFKGTFSFTDPSGNQVSGDVVENYVFHPSNSSGSFDVAVPSSQATVSNGTITLPTVCIVFGTNASMDLTISLLNATGNQSNTLTANIPKPAGGGSTGRPRVAIEPPDARRPQ